MTISFRYVEDLDADWPRLWPMIEAFQQHHARAVGLELRLDGEARSRQRMANELAAGGYRVQLAEDDGAAIAMATVRVMNEGMTAPGPVGYIGDGFIVPEARGRGVMSQMFEIRKEWLRERGISIVERSVQVDNDLAMAAWSHLIWGFFLRRPAPEQGASPPAAVRHVTGLDADWPRIWALLKPRATRDEARTRERVGKTFEKRGRIVLTEDEPGGVAVARYVNDPWIVVERICAIRELGVADGAPPAVTDALLTAVESWMLRKGASHLQVGPIREDLAEPWFKRGFSPYMLRLSEPI